MVIKIALGVVLGSMLFRFIRHRHCRHGGHFGGFRGRRMMFLARHLRDLDLSPEQVDALRPLWLAGKNAVSLARFSHLQAAHGLFSAISAEPLDRARLDAVATRHAEDQAQARRDLIDALAKAHEVLTPDQREKLRRKIGWMAGGRGGGWGEGQGPYRTVL